MYYYKRAMTTAQTTPELEPLPDDINWKDRGCELFSACLSCPLPRCIEDEPRGKQRLRMLARASQMAQLRRQGKSTAEVAELFHVSKRTVQRVLSSFKATGGVRNE
jgi:hypothetical protein